MALHSTAPKPRLKVLQTSICTDVLVLDHAINPEQTHLAVAVLIGTKRAFQFPIQLSQKFARTITRLGGKESNPHFTG